MTDERISAFESFTLLQELKSDRPGLEVGLRLLTAQDQQSALLADRIRNLRWLAAAVRDGEWISDNQLSDIVTDADDGLRELWKCRERNAVEQRWVEAQLNQLAVAARPTSRWTRLRHQWRRLLGQKGGTGDKIPPSS